MTFDRVSLAIWRRSGVDAGPVNGESPEIVPLSPGGVDRLFECRLACRFLAICDEHDHAPRYAGGNECFR